MSYPTFPGIVPTEAPIQYKTRTLQTKFGDGYKQTVGDGLNNVEMSIGCVWKNLTETEMRTIEDFLVARKGYQPFEWTPPRMTGTFRWTCKEWARTPLVCLFNDFTATFEQWFGF